MHNCNMIKFKGIIAFDLDGTLIDSAPDLSFSLNKVLEENSFPLIKESEARQQVGHGAVKLIEYVFEKNKINVNKNKIEQLRKRFLEIYDLNCIRKTSLFPNAYDVLCDLKKANVTMVIVSNKPKYYILKILKNLKIESFFEAISGGDSFKVKKPDPKHLLFTINKIDADIKDCVFVGDTEVDLICAKKASIPMIITSHGYSNINYNNLDSDYKIDDFNQLIEKLNIIYKKK